MKMLIIADYIYDYCYNFISKDVFRLVLPDWEGEYPWEIYSGISQKAHFKRQIKFETDKVFCLVASADNVQDKQSIMYHKY